MRARPCVRCGCCDRGEDLFLCYPCASDRVKEQELKEAMEATRDLIGTSKDRGLAQRQFLVENFRWAGGWSRK